jgi:hypothetical protein
MRSPWRIAPRGDEQRATAHVRLWKDERLYPADPLMTEITDLLKTAVVFENPRHAGHGRSQMDGGGRSVP